MHARLLMGTTGETIVTEAIAVGEIRGCIERVPTTPQGEPPDANLRVDRYLYGRTSPYSSTVPVDDSSDRFHPVYCTDGSYGVLTFAWEGLLHASEQRAGSAVLIGSGIDPDSGELWAGGLMATGIEHGSEAGLTAVANLRDAWEAHTDIGWLADLMDASTTTRPAGGNPPDVLADSAGLAAYAVGLRACVNAFVVKPTGGEITESTVHQHPCVFRCRCEKGQFVNKLQLLPATDTAELLSSAISTGEPLQLTCHNCNESYRVPVAELEAVLRSAAS